MAVSRGRGAAQIGADLDDRFRELRLNNAALPRTRRKVVNLGRGCKPLKRMP